MISPKRAPTPCLPRASALHSKGKIMRSPCWMLGGLHVAWNNKEHVRPVSKDYDLRSAYRQLPLHPEEQLKAILLLKNPSSGMSTCPVRSYKVGVLRYRVQDPDQDEMIRFISSSGHQIIGSSCEHERDHKLLFLIPNQFPTNIYPACPAVTDVIGSPATSSERP